MVASVMFGFTYFYAFCSKWLTQVYDCNSLSKDEINQVRIEWTNNKRRTDKTKTKLNETTLITP